MMRLIISLVCLALAVECDRKYNPSSPQPSHSKPRTYRLIQDLVRSNYERSLRQKHESLHNRASTWWQHLRKTRLLGQPVVRKSRKIETNNKNNLKIFASNNKASQSKYNKSIPKKVNKPKEDNDIDRTFKIPQLFKQKSKPSSLGSNPSFVIKPAGL